MEARDDEVPGAAAGNVRRLADGAAGDAAKDIAARDVAAGAKAKRVYQRVKLSDAAWREAEDFYLDGATAAQVSAKFGMSVAMVYWRMKRLGKQARMRLGRAAAAVVDEGGRGQGARDASGGERADGPWLVDARAWADKFGAVLRTVFGKAPPGARTFWMLVMDRWDAMSVSQSASWVDRAGRRRTLRLHSQEIWVAARRDYEVGDFTLPEIAERYEMTVSALKARSSRETWRKTRTVAPRPLRPPDDPNQVDESGRSKWLAIAHEAQRPPEGEWSTWLFQGGRGAGKTRAGAEWLAAMAETTPDGRFALVAATEHDLREVMIEGASGICSLPGRDPPRYESSRRKLKWTNGAVAYGFSAEQPERLRGPQFMAAWADEFCTWRRADDVLLNLRMGLRMGDNPRLVVTTTPKPVGSLRRLRGEASCVITQAGTSANEANLAASFIAGIEALYGGTPKAEQELEGLLVEGDGSMWTQAQIERARGPRPERFDRVIVAVDPAVGLEGSECGIVVAGRLEDRLYVLADCSVGGMSPLGWAGVVARAAAEFGAGRIVAEGNQGGELVRSVLAIAGAPCRVETVHARLSKRARAEPAHLLYEKGKVVHCGVFGRLEEQLLAMGVSEEETGLDRADALVWALTTLMPMTPPPKVWAL